MSIRAQTLKSERELESGIIRAAAAHGNKKFCWAALSFFQKVSGGAWFDFCAHGSQYIPEMNFQMTFHEKRWVNIEIKLGPTHRARASGTPFWANQHSRLSKLTLQVLQLAGSG